MLREDEDKALNMSVSDNIQHVLENLGKLDTLDTLLMKTLAKVEKLETHVNDLDLKCPYDQFFDFHFFTFSCTI